MAINLGFDPVTPPPGLVASTSNYRSTYDLTNQWFPELAEELMRVRSRGSLTGFLDLHGSKEGFSADQVRWAEEGERHVIHEASVARAGNVFTLASHKIRPGIKILVSDPTNDEWALARVTSTTSTTFTAEPYSYADFNAAITGTTGLTVMTAGSEFLKGASGQTASLEMQVNIYDNKPIIMNDTFKINNSDLTNTTWFKVNGSYFWYNEQFDETMMRWADDMEIDLLVAEEAVATSSLYGTYDGTEGYFTALRNRGITQQGLISTLADWKAIVKVLDRVHGESSYYGYFDRDQTNAVDEFLAGLNKHETNSANYGIFDNDPGMAKQKALDLGFSGFKWNDYSFYKQTWNVLKDPTKFGSVNIPTSAKVHGVLFPNGTTPTAENPLTGAPAVRVPYVTLMYKEMPGYSRQLEKFFLGSGRIATPTTAEDSLQMVLRSERLIRTVGARKQILIAGS